MKETDGASATRVDRYRGVRNTIERGGARGLIKSRKRPAFSRLAARGRFFFLRNAFAIPSCVANGETAEREGVFCARKEGEPRESTFPCTKADYRRRTTFLFASRVDSQNESDGEVLSFSSSLASPRESDKIS